MANSLRRVGNVSVSTTEPGPTRILIGLGWDAWATDGANFDLDASVYMIGSGQKARQCEVLLHYNKRRSPDGSIRRAGDDMTFRGETDDEVILVDLDAVPADMQTLAITVTIYEAKVRKQNFGQLNNLFICLVNEETWDEIAPYDLSEDYSTETEMIFGDVYRHNGDWLCRAVGQGCSGDISPLRVQSGIDVA